MESKPPSYSYPYAASSPDISSFTESETPPPPTLKNFKKLQKRLARVRRNKPQAIPGPPAKKRKKAKNKIVKNLFTLNEFFTIFRKNGSARYEKKRRMKNFFS